MGVSRGPGSRSPGAPLLQIAPHFARIYQGRQYPSSSYNAGKSVCCRYCIQSAPWGGRASYQSHSVPSARSSEKDPNCHCSIGLATRGVALEYPATNACICVGPGIPVLVTRLCAPESAISTLRRISVLSVRNVPYIR
jgi:hypothetical protein